MLLILLIIQIKSNLYYSLILYIFRRAGHVHHQKSRSNMQFTGVDIKETELFGKQFIKILYKPKPISGYNWESNLNQL